MLAPLVRDEHSLVVAQHAVLRSLVAVLSGRAPDAWPDLAAAYSFPESYPLFGSAARSEPALHVEYLLPPFRRHNVGPVEAITHVYGLLLQLEVVDGRLTASGHRRRVHGSYFTPMPAARQLVELALSPLSRRPIVLDPSMGTGMFLMQAARFLGGGARVAEECLWGIDRDPLAVELAVLGLWLETGGRPEILARHLRCGDALHDWPSGEFDAIIGNPPWGLPFSVAERQDIGRHFPHLYGVLDSSKVFLDLAARRTRGTVGMVVPQALLAERSHEDIRKALLDSCAPYSAVDLGCRQFPGAVAPAVSLIFGPRPGPPQVRIVRGGISQTVPAARWTPARFPFEQRWLERWERLCALHPALADLSCYQIRDAGLNYNRATVSRRVFYAGEREDPRDLPRFRGRNFGRYTPVSQDGWLRHNARDLLQKGEMLSGGWETYRLPEKLVLRQTADRIIATLDRSRMVMGRSVIAITAAGASLPALLACLNSSLVHHLYSALAGENGRVLPQVKVGYLAQLPVPAVACRPILPETLQAARRWVSGQDIPHDQALRWACLHVLAENLLAIEGMDERLLARVDEIVCSLYESNLD